MSSYPDAYGGYDSPPLSYRGVTLLGKMKDFNRFHLEVKMFRYMSISHRVN